MYSSNMMVVEENNYGTPVPTNSKQKYCKWCGNGLSMYNRTGFCFCHANMKREYEDQISRRKETRRQERAAALAAIKLINNPPKPKKVGGRKKKIVE